MKVIVKIKFYNAEFREARFNLGFDTMSKLAKATGISIITLYEIESLRCIPKKKAIIEKLESTLYKSFDELFSGETIIAVSKKIGKPIFVKKEVNPLSISWANQNLKALEYRPFAGDTKEVILKSFNYLTDKERKVIELRFFEVMTLKEAANICKVTQERVRQIEAKALKKLRHPSHHLSELLVDK